MNGSLFLLAINTYQLQAGLSHPILKDTQPCPWILAGWLSSLWPFLHNTNSQIILNKPSSCRHMDHYLMDDISKCNLSTRELQLIHNVWVYLHVTMLLEISNHSSTHVLPQYLHTTDLRRPFSHTYLHIGSTLKWPTQPIPGPKSWKIWSHTVQRLYCHTNSTKLLESMGVWKQDSYAVNWTWMWYLCTISTSLYQHNNNHWHEYTPTLTCQTYALYSTQPTNIQNDPPAHIMPVTLTFTNQDMCIDLPAAHIHLTTTHPPVQPTLRIDQWITLPLTQWEDKLWVKIQGQTCIPNLYQHITWLHSNYLQQCSHEPQPW